MADLPQYPRTACLLDARQRLWQQHMSNTSQCVVRLATPRLPFMRDADKALVRTMLGPLMEIPQAEHPDCRRDCM